MTQLLNVFKQSNEIVVFFRKPYIQYKNIFEDFTIHKPIIEKITEKDLMSIPAPTPKQLLGLFPIDEIVYYHIVTAIATSKKLNKMLLTLVPQQMNEMIFWYKYFTFLFTKENDIHVLAFGLFEDNALVRTVTGEKIGTLIKK